jgi:hypothetical protein
MKALHMSCADGVYVYDTDACPVVTKKIEIYG